MRASEFWLTIPRASRRPDPTRAGAECVVYEVTCALHVENARTRRSDPTAGNSPATTSSAVDVDASSMSASMNAIERVTKRRYREFVALRDDLEVECGRDSVPELPPRRMFQRVNASDDKVEERRRKLEGWLWALLAIERCARSEALARFVRLGACERALRRARDASSIRSGKSAVESPGMDVMSPVSSMRPMDTPGSSRSVESSGSKRAEGPLSDELGATATATEPSPIKEPGQSMKEALKMSREMASKDAMLEEMRAEMGALRDELETTRECLNDARATTCAAETKFKELEARTHKEKKVLSKEIRSLRKQLEAAQIDSNEQANIISAEERTAALSEIMHEVSVLRSRVHECTYEKLISEDSDGDPNELLSVSDNRLAVLLAEAQILIVGVDETAPAASTTTTEGAEAETKLMHTEREVRQTFADLLSDLINTRKSINSLLRKVAKKNENGSSTDARVGTGISSRVGNLVGAIEKKLTIPQ